MFFGFTFDSDTCLRQMLQKYAEESRLEQMNDQKRRMKQLEHRHAVEAIILDRRQRVEEERRSLLEINKEHDEISKYRKDVIEQERQRMLREHAANLIGFLPKVC